jgi:ribosomal protein L29
MKTNEKKDLQTKTKTELVKLLQDAQALLVSLRLDHQQNKLQNTSEITNTRRRIAVLQTILTGKPADAVVEEKETKKKEVKK